MIENIGAPRRFPEPKVSYYRYRVGREQSAGAQVLEH
jgi:hypothetical protein